MSASRYVHLEDCKIITTTDAAILVEFDEDRYWFPKSQVADPETFKGGDGPVTVSITEWIANKHGIEVE
jgi:hypothetical protein